MTQNSKKPTLLVLASTFPRWKDDTEPRFVYDLCLRLKEEYTIIVLAPHEKGAKKQEVIEGLQVHRYRYAPDSLEILAYEGGISAKLKGNKLNYLILPFFFLGQWIAIIKLLKQYPVKVIHAHWLIPQGILALIARLVSINKPAILCTSHGGDLYGLNDPISKIIKRYVIKKVDAMTVVSHAMQDEIKKLVPTAKQAVVAPMGTDLSNLFIPDDSVKRKSYQLLFVGRLVEKKGLQYLLQAMPDIIKQYPETCLNIAGTGPEQASLEVLIKELKLAKHVFFLGRLSHQALVNEYRQATVAVFPFVQAKNGDVEGLGLVMIEAMGCGCPVVASDIPAVRDVIINNSTGILSETGNKIQLTEKIIELLSHKDRRKVLAKKARKYMFDRFSWDKTAISYQALLQKLVDKH